MNFNYSTLKKILFLTPVIFLVSFCSAPAADASCLEIFERENTDTLQHNYRNKCLSDLITGACISTAGIIADIASPVCFGFNWTVPISGVSTVGGLAWSINSLCRDYGLYSCESDFNQKTVRLIRNAQNNSIPLDEKHPYFVTLQRGLFPVDQIADVISYMDRAGQLCDYREVNGVIKDFHFIDQASFLRNVEFGWNTIFLGDIL